MIRHEPISPEFERARARYLATLKGTRDTPAYRTARLVYSLAVRLWCHLAFLLCIGLTTLGCVAMAQGAEGRWVMAEVTAYCPCSTCTDGDGLTANMTNVKRVPYAFAADRSLAIGTRVYVPTGLGVLDNVRADDRWFPVDDRGGALDTEAKRYAVIRLDLRVRDHWWAVRFGRQRLPVFIAPPL